MLLKNNALRSLNLTLGKGEVVSSILPGSTRKPVESMGFCRDHCSNSASRYGTSRERDVSNGAESV